MGLSHVLIKGVLSGSLSGAKSVSPHDLVLRLGPSRCVSLVAAWGRNRSSGPCQTKNTSEFQKYRLSQTEYHQNLKEDTPNELLRSWGLDLREAGWPGRREWNRIWEASRGRGCNCLRTSFRWEGCENSCIQHLPVFGCCPSRFYLRGLA